MLFNLILKLLEIIIYLEHFIFKLNSSFLIIRLRNKNGYSISSEAAELFILNKDQLDGSTTVKPILDPALLPSKPKIEQAVYAFKSLYIKWALESNGGSDVNQISIFIIKYGLGGVINTNTQSNFFKSFIRFLN